MYPIRVASPLICDIPEYVSINNFLIYVYFSRIKDLDFSRIEDFFNYK